MVAYRTISRPSQEILFKEKKSKFYGYAFPLRTDKEVKAILEAVRKKHSSAGHVCYAWQLGVEKIRYRANDDGEPNNSAGIPIYGQIQSFELTNVLVAVARIYGGTKLGVSGLISAYREAAKMALEASHIVERKIKTHYRLQFSYAEMNKVMVLVKKLRLEITSQKMETECEMFISVEKENEKIMLEKFASLHKVSLSKLDQDFNFSRT